MISAAMTSMLRLINGSSDFILTTLFSVEKGFVPRGHGPRDLSASTHRTSKYVVLESSATTWPVSPKRSDFTAMVLSHVPQEPGHTFEEVVVQLLNREGLTTMGSKGMSERTRQTHEFPRSARNAPEPPGGWPSAGSGYEPDPLS